MKKSFFDFTIFENKDEGFEINAPLFWLFYKCIFTIRSRTER